MAKEKFDFDAYQKWCEEKHLVASESASLEQYKVELAKVAETGEKERKISAQKEIFEAICNQVGKKVKYDPDQYDELQKALESIVYAMDMCNMMKDIFKVIDKHDVK